MTQPAMQQAQTLPGVQDWSLDPAIPVLIYGPTASGKSALALDIAETHGGIIVNADASQVFENWSVVTARPDAADLARAPHALYGHLPYDAAYSVGDWLREVQPLLSGPTRPIIVGGTGLYFKALTEGLVDIPATPAVIRAEVDALRLGGQLDAMVAALDAPTRAQIDIQNPMRVQRALEVLRSTGRGLVDWQAATPPPALPLSHAMAISVVSDPAWLQARIERRFDSMLAGGALDEARRNAPHYDPDLLSMKAIGAVELIRHVRGEIDRDTAHDLATIATRQFAKRQRTWARARMRDWQVWNPQG